MKGILTNPKLEYVLFHLNMNLGISSEIRDAMIFLKEEDPVPEKAGIIFKLSEKDYDSNSVLEIDSLAVLFPLSEGLEFYSIQKNSVVFHHDLIKSSFYLLSAYQELDPEYLDSMGRFPYDLSVQKKFDFAGKPLVNYYFKILAKGILEFCKLNKLEYSENRIFENYGLYLSHDIDTLDTYTFNRAIFIFKQAFGLSPSTLPRRKTMQIAFKYLFKYLNIFRRENPHWSFDLMRSIERKFGFRSAFFFLPKGQKHIDASYSFEEKRVKKLFKSLEDEECEIGIHGTVRSSVSAEALAADLKSLQEHVSQEVCGMRQHRLMYDINKTADLHEKQGLVFDSSLGFAEHEGFRNSYCLPFRLYDHQNDRMRDLWEIPLNVMDVTLFHYRSFTPEQSKHAVKKLISEVRKFGGVFTVLWHNSFFDEDHYPGITEFYKDFMQQLSDSKPECLTGKEIISRVNS